MNREYPLNHPGFQKREARRLARRGVRARFFNESGREYVEIRVIGDSSVYRGKVTDEHKQRFPEEWKAYQTGKVRKVSGTPLTDLDDVTPALAKLYEEAEIRTAEELVALSDAAVRNLGIIDAANLRRRAQAKLGQPKGFLDVAQ